MPQHILRGVGAARHQRRQFDRRRRRFYQCPLPRVRLIFRRCATSFVAFAMVSMLFMSLPMTFATFRALFISLACRAPRLCRRLPCLSRLSRLPWFFRRPLRFTHIRHCFPSIVRKNWHARVGYDEHGGALFDLVEQAVGLVAFVVVVVGDDAAGHADAEAVRERV